MIGSTGADRLEGRHSGTIMVGMGDGSVRFIRDSIDVGTWRPFGPSYTGGVSVAGGDIDGDGRADIVAGMLEGGRITSIAVDNSDPLGQATFMEPYGTDFSGGIFVGAAPVAHRCPSSDINGDGDFGTDADIEAFFACLAGNCCNACGTADFNRDGDVGTDADIEAFFRVLGGGGC
jgi:prepilin-type processing-associated H-X9-DG protein